MAILHYIDNEVPALAEWDAKVEAGASTIGQSAAASFPERGAAGLLATIVAAQAAYLEKNLPGATPTPAVGFWLCMNGAPTWVNGNYIDLARIYGAGAALAAIVRLRNSAGSANLQVYAYDNAAATSWMDTLALVPNRWYYVAVVGSWSRTQASLALYIDGVLTGTAVKVGDARTKIPEQIRTGVVTTNATAVSLYLDEFKITDGAYPEPWAPAPADEYPCPERTCVLWRRASADSRAFADYCVSELGVPRGNLVPLLNATAPEAAASYAAFQTQVENDLAAWLALNPTIAANCSCFLIGYGVPGAFTSGGVLHSAASRLMNFGTAFASKTDNPLYNPAAVERLTKTALGGKYLACRIDADSLAHAQAIIDRAAVVAALPELPEDANLETDEAAYADSTACQRTRLFTYVGPQTYHSAVWWGDPTGFTLESGGVQAIFADDVAADAATLRSAATVFDEAILGEYAAGLGLAGPADGLAIEPFMEMLRLGGSLAEAFAVAIEHLDYTAVPVGVPLMTVAFRRGGYNVYRGAGGADSIDYTAAVGHVYVGVIGWVSPADVAYPDGVWWHGVRAVSDSGVEEDNTSIVWMTEISGGALVPLAPNPVGPGMASAAPAAGGKVRVSGFYEAADSPGSVSGIEVARVAADGTIDWGAVLDTILLAGSGPFTWLSNAFDDGESVPLALRAVTALGGASAALLLDAVTADATAPGDVDYVTAEMSA